MPSDASLAFLLGSAIGVMGTVSIIELWLRNAAENSFPWVTLAVAAGAALFCLIDPLLPHAHEGGAWEPVAGDGLDHKVCVCVGWGRGPRAARGRRGQGRALNG